MQEKVQDQLPQLLCVSGHQVLLTTRAQVLKTRYEVTTLRGLDGLEALSAESAFYLCILCHTLGQNECRKAAERCRALWPGIRILVLLKQWGNLPCCDGDRSLSTTEGPERLLECVSDMLHGNYQRYMPANSAEMTE